MKTTLSTKRFWLLGIAGGLVLSGAFLSFAQEAQNLPAEAFRSERAGKLALFTRWRAASPEGGQLSILYKTVFWDPAKTAAIVCDMWDNHHCPSAARRVNEMAPRMNRLLHALRNQGVLIIHAPSDTMKFYEGWPQRQLALAAPKVDTQVPLLRWCKLDPEREGPLPIDDSDGGCPEPDEPKIVWTRQNELLEILPQDAIGDGFEIIYLLKQRGIENVLIMGVHTNMCVLGRPFGIRQLVRQGFNVLLVRDMTDSMYNPARPPYVRHVRGTELVIEHIERYWCPTVSSGDILGEPAFRFPEDDRPHVTFLVSDDHYQADKLLPQFAQELSDRYDCYTSVIHGQGKNYLWGIEELAAADCLVLYVRRLALTKEQLDAIRAYLAAGKPLVALRTASHAFDVRGEPPAGCAEWPEFDPEVLGGNYKGHTMTGGSLVYVVPEQSQHPVVAGLPTEPWRSEGTLYLASPVREDATILMLGEAAGRKEPVTWVRTYQGGRVFYTSLGHPKDFESPAFRQLLINAIFWAMNRPVPQPRQ
ncbi:MAG: isochorismatase family protein [Thermoguttaceae bacterium]|nr:isochorismatase family protein [Thermoguttaceae bacterium]MDW8078717.1 ThuA domain-containing protein [Thermoguttaceae bacterium]